MLVFCAFAANTTESVGDLQMLVFCAFAANTTESVGDLPKPLFSTQALRHLVMLYLLDIVLSFGQYLNSKY
jgi:hypothetical protein